MLVHLFSWKNCGEQGWSQIRIANPVPLVPSCCPLISPCIWNWRSPVEKQGFSHQQRSLRASWDPNSSLYSVWARTTAQTWMRSYNNSPLFSSQPNHYLLTRPLKSSKQGKNDVSYLRLLESRLYTATPPNHFLPSPSPLLWSSLAARDTPGDQSEMSAIASILLTKGRLTLLHPSDIPNSIRDSGGSLHPGDSLRESRVSTEDSGASDSTLL